MGSPCLLGRSSMHLRVPPSRNCCSCSCTADCLPGSAQPYLEEVLKCIIIIVIITRS